MKNYRSLNDTFEDPTYTKLVESPLYQTYKKAFRDLTGMNLGLRPADDEIAIAPQEKQFLNPFCKFINGAVNPCLSCVKAKSCLMTAENGNGQTITCFADMKETAIPVRCGEQTIAYLTTGEVFTEPPQDEDFDEIAELIDDSCGTSLESLRKAWISGRTMSVDQYRGAITLLAAFALQLSELLNRLMIEEVNAEPEVVTTAKQYVMVHLEDKISLEEVANRVGVSSFYFCKVFKSTTGMTLTEYINRRRVEWAKQKLANPLARITEIAFDVGYQSLSQFNRSFLKYVGMSPSRYRDEQSSRAVMDRKFAAL
jgi:AraC-like DNA-binding protein